MKHDPDPDEYAEKARQMLNDLEELTDEHADFVDRVENIIGNILDQINDRKFLTQGQADLLDDFRNEIDNKIPSVY